MPEIPKIMLRVRPEHQSLVRELAARLTADSGFAATLAALLESPSAAETAALTARVVMLETAMAEVQQILVALLEELQGRRHDPLPLRSSVCAVEFSDGPADWQL